MTFGGNLWKFAWNYETNRVWLGIIQIIYCVPLRQIENYFVPLLFREINITEVDQRKLAFQMFALSDPKETSSLETWKLLSKSLNDPLLNLISR